MARIKMITRTIKSLHVTALCFNTVDSKTEEITYTLPSGVSADKALDFVRQEYETSTNKVIMINAVKEVEKVYGMRETRFIELAQELDKETRKALTEEELAEDVEEIECKEVSKETK